MTACGASNEDSGDSDSGLSGELNGAGSTAQEAAMTAWKAGFQGSNSGVTVNYDGVGSGGGREQFLAGGVNFAGSDAFLSDEELAAAQQTCGSDPVEVPVYVSTIAVIFNLDGVDTLQLSPATLADIFSGKITQWNDPAIAAENSGVTLPGEAITPVHRSDDSGTTQNFTDYLAQAAPDNWTYPAAQTWPVQGGEAGEGTSGVVAAVKSGAGTIGYADASQAGDLGKAMIKVGSSYAAPTAEGAAKALDESDVVSGRPSTDVAISVNRTTTADGAYPIILVSYQITCQLQKDAATADLVKSFETYVVSSDGQQAAAEAAGSAPLSDSLAAKAQAAIDTIAAK